MTKCELITGTALSLVGTPFQHAGRTPSVGLDCWGVVAISLAAAGLATDPDVSYPVSDLGDRMEAELAKHCEQVGDIQAGDIVILRPRGSWAHVGIVVDLADGDAIVHAVDRRAVGGVVCELIDDRVSRWVQRVWRVKESE